MIRSKFVKSAVGESLTIQMYGDIKEVKEECGVTLKSISSYPSRGAFNTACPVDGSLVELKFVDLFAPGIIRWYFKGTPFNLRVLDYKVLPQEFNKFYYTVAAICHLCETSFVTVNSSVVIPDIPDRYIGEYDSELNSLSNNCLCLLNTLIDHLVDINVFSYVDIKVDLPLIAELNKLEYSIQTYLRKRHSK